MDSVSYMDIRIIFGYFRKYVYCAISISMIIISLVLKIPVELTKVLSRISRNVYSFSTSLEPTEYLECILLSKATLVSLYAKLCRQ